MIIEVRLRDIPFEEAAKCFPVYAKTRTSVRWESRRGTPMWIVVPGESGPHTHFICEGPFFAVFGEPYRENGVDIQHYVCPHMAEIGD